MIATTSAHITVSTDISRARVLYVTEGFAPFVVGGMQTVARRHIESLVASRFEVISVSSKDGGQPADLAWRNISIPWPRRTFLQQLSPYRYVRDLDRFSLEVAQIIDEVLPEVIYSEGPLIAAYLRRPRAQRIPTIFHPHGLEMFQHKGSLVEDAKSWPLRSIVGFHARNADFVLCLGKRSILSQILTKQCGALPERVFSMPNAVSLDQSLATKPRSRPAGGRFLFVGRNEPRKGVRLLLNAFRELSGAKLDLVGAYALPADAPANVVAHGEVRDRDRMRKHFAAADFVVVPSYAEGMPTVILEAFAQAVPVIATDVGASADPVRTGETGFLIPPGDVTALKDALTTAMALDQVAYKRLSSNCLAEARTTYAPETIQRRLVGLFERLTRRPASGDV